MFFGKRTLRKQCPPNPALVGFELRFHCLNHVSTVDHNFLSRDVRGLSGCKKDRKVSDFLHGSHPSQRHGLPEVPNEDIRIFALVDRHFPHAGSIDIAGNNGVDVYAVFRDVEGKGIENAETAPFEAE